VIRGLRQAAMLDGASLRGAWWALRAVRSVRRDLRDRPLDAVRVPAPEGLPARAARGVLAVLRRLEPTCLERSLVLQRWLAAHGEPRPVVIGVKAPAREFSAHAWLEGESARGYEEITRILP
jgi:hypothetical protein